MSWFYYLAYLAAIAIFSAALCRLGGVQISLKRFAYAVLPVFLVFVSWDIIAAERGHWEFGLQYMTGIVIINQPIEELLFFVVAPFFYLTVWEVTKRAWGKWNIQ
ncbi:MAG: lycopene cyclase domain-containing protein [Candidatus Micrarchaeota archaeon]|nr:lycopene cyclase domain-containing protein [Candidatus Micrarchaeota archaeon]